MPTLSVPCDGIVECSDGSDEASCKKQNLSTYLLGGSIIFIVLLYLAIKYCKRKPKMVIDSNNQQHYSMITLTKELEETLQEFERSGNTSKKIITKMNSQLFCAIHTLKTDESKEVLMRFYNFQAKLENNDESKIFHSLHQILDPALVKEIAEVKFPGFTQQCIDCMECLFCSRWITWLQDKIIEKEWLSELIATVLTVARIIASFSDVFKDVFLTVTLVVILGGPLEVLRYPTRFTSVIVMGLATSIVVPLLTSSLHLAINNPNMIYNFTGVRRSVVIIIHLVNSFLNPLLLINRYESAKEKIRSVTKTNSDYQRVPSLIQKSRMIKKQLADFWRIELGEYSSSNGPLLESVTSAVHYNLIYSMTNYHTVRLFQG